MKHVGKFYIGSNQAGKGDRVSRRWPQKKFKEMYDFINFPKERTICSLCDQEINEKDDILIIYKGELKLCYCSKCKDKGKKLSLF